MVSLQQKPKVDLDSLYEETKVDLDSLYEETKVDLDTLYEETKPQSSVGLSLYNPQSGPQAYGTSGIVPPPTQGATLSNQERLLGLAGELVGGIASGTGMALEAAGRLGESLFRPGGGPDFAGVMPPSVDQPGGMRRTGVEAKEYGQEVLAPEREAVQQAGGATAAAGKVLNAAGTSVPVIAGAVASGPLALGGAAVVGATMGYTAFRDEAKAYGATDEDADLAGWVGAASGGLQAAPMIPMLGLLKRLPLAVKGAMKAYLGAVAATGAGEVVQEGGDQFLQNLVAKYWVGYDKERSLAQNVMRSAAVGGGSGILLGLFGLGAGRVLKGPETGEDAPQEPGVEPVEPPTSQEAPGSTLEAEVPVVEAAAPEPEQATVESVSEPVAELEAKAEPVAPEVQPATLSVADERPVPEPEAKAEAKPPVSEPTPTGALSDLTGIANEEMDAEFIALGRDPPTHGERLKGDELVREAKAKIDADPTAGERLVNSLTALPRIITSQEDAMLTVEMVRLKNARDAAEAELDKAVEAGDGVEDAIERIKSLTDAFIKTGEAATLSGTQQGQSLAFRKLLLKRDFSLVNLERTIQVAKGGEALTTAERAEIKELHKRYALLEQEHAKEVTTRKALEAEKAAGHFVSSVKARAARARKPRGQIRERLHTEAQASREWLKKNMSRARTGLDVEALGHLAKVGADVIASGAAEFKVWSEAIIGEVGEQARPYLEQAYAKAKGIVSELRLGHLAGRVAERTASGKDIGRYASKIAEHFVGEGVTEIEALIDKVHGVLKKADKTITREQARDAMSGYGQFRELTEDEVKRTLADLKSQAQKLAQIEALEKKIAPLKTGFERVEPSAETRELQKRVNELRKQAGIKVEDPAHALRTALQQRERSLKNRIEDLQHEIDTGELTVETPSAPPTSPLTDTLEKQLDALKKQHEAVFGKPGATDEQKAQAAIRATEKSIAENERRIHEHDLAKRGKMQGPPANENLARLQAQRQALVARNNALRAELEEMRAAAEGPIASAKEKALQKQIDAMLAIGPKQPRGSLQGPSPDPKVEKLKAELERMRASNKLARKRTPEEISNRSADTRITNRIAELKERMARGDFAKKALRRPIALHPDVVKKAAELKAVEVEFARLKRKHEMASRTKRQRALDAVKELLDFPRAIWSAFDVSAVLRQGGLVTFGQSPLKTMRQAKEMFRALASEAYARKVDTELRARPGYEFGKASGLELTSIDHEMGAKEEAIHSRWSDSVPGVRPSNRAFITFLNIQRAEAFDAMVRALPGNPTLAQGEILAHTVNVFTGRGGSKALGPALSKAATILWAPRLLASRIQFFTGAINLANPLSKSDAATRAIIAKQYAKTLVGMSAMYGLASLAGIEWEDDPRASGFGQFKIGDTLVDPMAGLRTITVLSSRVITGETVSREGKERPIDITTLANFGRSKLTPLLGIATNLALRKDFEGKPSTPLTEVKKAATPLSFGQLYEAIMAEGVSTGVALGILGMFGAGLTTIEDKK